MSFLSEHGRTWPTGRITWNRALREQLHLCPAKYLLTPNICLLERQLELQLSIRAFWSSSLFD